MPEDPKQNLIDSTLKFLEAEFVSAQEFQQGMAMLLGQMKDVVEEGDKSLTETDQKLVSLIEEKIAEINDKIKESDNVSSTDKKGLTEAIRGLKSDVTDSIKALKKELSDDIELAGNTDAIEADIAQIKLDMEKPVLVETGLTIKKKLLGLPDKDKLKIQELIGYDELLKLIDEKGRSRGFVVPQSGITTTFFSYQGTVIGRAKNINIDPNATGVTLQGDTATIGLGGGGGTWTPQGVTTATVGNIPAGTNLGTDPILIADTLIDMFYDTSPSISLTSSPTQGLREFGDDITSILLSATTTASALPITSVTFYRNGGLINTVVGPNPAGGVETYTDTDDITSLTTFYAKVGDGVNTPVQSNTLTFSFVYPFYYGVAGVGTLNEAAIEALTKLVQVKQTTLTTTSPTNQTYVIAYPSSYGALTSIKDASNFETIGDYNVYTVTVTGLDGTPVDYLVYQLDHITTQTNFNNTFYF